MSTPTPWINRSAARAVAERAIPVAPDAADRKELLDMLGLLGPDQPCCNHEHGHPGIAPDLSDDELRSLGSPIAVANSDLGEHLSAAKRTAGITNPPALNGALCPPGLRAVIQGAPPVDTPTEPTPVKAVAKVIPAPPKTPRERKPRVYAPRPARPPQSPAPCGTEAAWQRHTRNNEPIDDACREARNEANRVRDRKRRDAGLVKPRPPAQCGTIAGYKRHQRAGTPKCQACLAVKAAENKKRYMQKNETAAQAA